MVQILFPKKLAYNRVITAHKGKNAGGSITAITTCNDALSTLYLGINNAVTFSRLLTSSRLVWKITIQEKGMGISFAHVLL
jgi:hypothetical protein